MVVKYFSIPLTVASILVAACATPKLSDDISQPNPNNSSTSNNKETDIVEVSEESKMLAKDNRQFGFDLYQQLKSQESNLFFSPASISLALAMTYAGANEETAKEMANALRFSLEDQKVHQSFSEKLSQWNQEDKSYQLSVANRLWGQEGFGFLPAYLEQTEKDYQAKLQELDFIKQVEQAIQTINTWVEEKTAGKIKDLIPEGALNDKTRLVLTNAIYFKGNWEKQFEEDATQEQPFFAPTGEVSTPLMSQNGTFEFAEQGDVKILSLPYVDKELSMVILLPKEKDGLAALEEKITEETVSDWISSLVSTKNVIVSLPRFKMSAEFSLSSVLQELGMKKAFSSQADFSGMNGEKNLFLSQVFHKAFVDVNEEGTEAAAATGVVVSVTSFSPPKEFRADHPFVFLIRDNQSGDILFLGRVVNPQS